MLTKAWSLSVSSTREATDSRLSCASSRSGKLGSAQNLTDHGQHGLEAALDGGATEAHEAGCGLDAQLCSERVDALLDLLGGLVRGTAPHEACSKPRETFLADRVFETSRGQHDLKVHERESVALFNQ